MKLSDFKGLLKKTTMKVVSVGNPYGDYFEVKLKVTDQTWEPGEHAVFYIPGKKIKGKSFRPFSVASIPEEGFLLIGTRTGEKASSFKQELIHLKPEENIRLIGPFGWFKLQDEMSPVVLIAGGVGITPIRAIVKQLETDHKREVIVIYSSKEYYLFGEELEEIAEKNDKITLLKTTSVEETQSLINEMIEKYNKDAYYFISGTIPMIKSIKKMIKAKGIRGKRIINDPFFGY